jgi:glycosyltransferase involved in cell wall biosynthesis
MPEVSVIMPAYNAARFIGEALQSVLQQTFQDFEIIVVDDGSTDDTARVVAGIGDPRIRYVYQENGGPSSARNHGLRLATGSFIAFLDADDVWEPAFLERMLSHLRTHPDLDGAYCGYRYMQADGTPLPEVVARVVPSQRLYEALLDGNFINMCSVVIRPRCFERIGGFDEALRQAEDSDLWLRAARTFQIDGVPDVLVWYRQHSCNHTLNLQVKLRSLQRLVEKHFGSDDTHADTWSAEKRLAYAAYYRMRAVILLRSKDVLGCARSLDRMLAIRPEWVREDKWYFMLVCANTERQRIGRPDAVDLRAAEADVFAALHLLSDLWNSTPGRSHVAEICGRMYWTFGTIAYYQKHIADVLKWYACAVMAYPALLLDRSKSYRMVRYTLGSIIWPFRRALNQIGVGSAWKREHGNRSACAIYADRQHYRRCGD